jgi:glycogen synthase
MLDTYGENYFLLGPYFPDKARLDFREIKDMGDCPLSASIGFLRSLGFEVYYGYWLLEDARPRVILINPVIDPEKLNEVKARLWCHHKISTIIQDDHVDSVLAFGEAVRLFMTEFVALTNYNQDVLAHYHEWMSASSLPELIREKVRVATVFTTHATVLGRYLISNENQYFSRISSFNWLEKAKEYGIESKAAIERSVAQNAHVLVTNSDLTAQECEAFFERKPDSIINNGINRKPGEGHEAFEEHQQNRAKIDSFVKAFFTPSYPVKTEKTLYFFTSGRYEYRNKGFDVTLEAMARLNGMLMQEHSELTVVLFVISRRPFHTIRPEVLEARKRFQDLNKICKEISSKLGPKIYSNVTGTAHRHKMPDLNQLVDDELLTTWKQAITNFKREALPPVTTHQLVYEDEITDFTRIAGLNNSAQNRVKIVYQPDFMERTKSLFGMDYLEFVRGCNLGIFPSLYEPWGNAAMETTLQGTPLITSNTSGFGRFVETNLPKYQQHELEIIDRKGQSFEEAVTQLTYVLHKFIETVTKDQFVARTSLPKKFLDSLCWTELQRVNHDNYRLALLRNQPVANLY